MPSSCDTVNVDVGTKSPKVIVFILGLPPMPPGFGRGAPLPVGAPLLYNAAPWENHGSAVVDPLGSAGTRT